MRILSQSVAAFLLLTALVQADLVIVQKVEGTGQSGTLTMKMKDSKSRTDVAPQISTITDGTGDVITLMHGEKVYMKIPLAQTQALMEQMKKLQPPAPAGNAAPKLVATGKKEKIEKYDCEIYTWTTPLLTATYWVSKDYPNYAKIAAAIEKNGNSGLAALAKDMAPKPSEMPGMIIKTEMALGPQKLTTTLVSVSEETLDPALFTIPADYKESPSPAFNFPGGN
jgi:hypothetical protein